MLKLDFKHWSVRVVLAVLTTLVLTVAVYGVAPIYGVNITPQSTTGFSNIGGSFGQLVPTHNTYSGG